MYIILGGTDPIVMFYKETHTLYILFPETDICVCSNVRTYHRGTLRCIHNGGNRSVICQISEAGSLIPRNTPIPTPADLYPPTTWEGRTQCHKDTRSIYRPPPPTYSAINYDRSAAPATPQTLYVCLNPQSGGGGSMMMMTYFSQACYLYIRIYG